ncbi:MAG: DMT family transporter [Turicibacter sp.]
MNQTKGVILTIVAALIFGFTPILAKITYGLGSNGINLTFFRACLALPILFGILKYRGVCLKITAKQLKQLIIVGVFGQAITTVTLYASYDYLSVGMATTIHFIYPALVVVALVVLYHEKLSKYKVISILFALVGMLLFMESGGSMSVWGLFLSILSGITYAFYILYIEKSGLKKMDPFKLTFYLSCVVSISVLIYGTLTQTITLNLTPIAWGLTLIISILVTVVAVVLMQIGIDVIGSAKVSILSLFEPVTSVVCGMILLNESLTIFKFFGCILVILSGVVIIKEKTETTNHPTNENKETITA